MLLSQYDVYFRIDIGGKVLTNHLKEVISYRYVQVCMCHSVYICCYFVTLAI